MEYLKSRMSSQKVDCERKYKGTILFLAFSNNDIWIEFIKVLTFAGYRCLLPGSILNKEEIYNYVGTTHNEDIIFFDPAPNPNKNYFPDYDEMKFYLEKYNPTVVFSLERNLSSLRYAIWAKLNKAKFIISTDIGYTLCDRYCVGSIKKFAHRLFDHLFTDGFYCTTILSYIDKISLNKPSLFVPISHFWKNFDNHNKLTSSKVIRFIFVGRIDERKNVKLLFDSFIKLQHQYGDKISIEFCGNGEYLDELKAKCINNCYFLGRVAYDNLLERICNSDVLILPSKGDTYGIPVHEALSCGIPVIVSNKVGSTYSHVQNYYNGLVYRTDNDLYSKMDEFIKDHDLREYLSFNSKKSIARFNKYSHSKDFLDFIGHIVPDNC